MRTSMTSAIAYRDHTASGAAHTQALAIKVTLKCAREPLSRAEIAERTGFPLASVCGRVAMLLEAGDIVERGTKRCEKTGRLVFVLGVARGGRVG